MSQTCPHCQLALTAPKMKQYEDNFRCPHCQIKLVHNETDILLYGFIFISLITISLVLIGHTNTFIAISIASISYHFLRPVFFEPHFRIKHADF
ncbi:hypothetical protein A0J46_01165 [Photobacterium damselae subsp. damselae]|nr:hypothetical protein A0J46_01165 [Photobacterium damselae subsp. damselae]